MERDVLKMERDMLKTKETELKTERDMIKRTDVIKTERDDQNGTKLANQDTGVFFKEKPVFLFRVVPDPFTGSEPSESVWRRGGE
ncbi:hypothetical protein NPIL_484451 [Nephila pilipes]|uniref:Uncharacterized protein n=1 Tax=Nephila pilipes TaxID=299642 RepID=A0A8X6Q4F0_NEPPI|nr:hypothetical protein NPIL_484451 [Nephila pilipes]